MAFVNLEKAFGRVNRARLWVVMKERGLLHHLISVVKSLYRVTQMKMVDGAHYIDVNRGVRQGCSLLMILFILYLDSLITKKEGTGTSRCAS